MVMKAFETADQSRNYRKFYLIVNALVAGNEALGLKLAAAIGPPQVW
jgi:hypothetical protein